MAEIPSTDSQNFPYIKAIQVNDCYTYQNFTISDESENTFKHFILTGKNGSGKTTILNRIALLQTFLKRNEEIKIKINRLKHYLNSNFSLHLSDKKRYKKELEFLEAIELSFSTETNEYLYFKTNEGNYVSSYFRAHRKVELDKVESVTKESTFVEELSKKSEQKPDYFIQKFKQYLVNKKVYEAFDYMNAKGDGTNQSQTFFEQLTDIMRRIFKDKTLDLIFEQESFEFFLKMGDGRKMTFNQLSEGFSAFLSILMELLMKVDLIRKQHKDFSFDPPGIVLIDEPETHFHLEMQYEILPILTSLFPNIQFIIATHSPAVISSLEDAIVYDLTTKETVKDWILGSSYSELMLKHFGLENEFGPKADKLIASIDQAYLSGDANALKNLFLEYEAILTPSLRIELESKIIALESK